MLIAVLDDRISDHFVGTLIWERLGYQKRNDDSSVWDAGANTPEYWSVKFPSSPPIISERTASVHLTRSIPKKYKQSLKEILNFQGYRVGELFPRKTRRATAVNWLLSWSLANHMQLPEEGPLPKFLSDHEKFEKH